MRIRSYKTVNVKDPVKITDEMLEQARPGQIHDVKAHGWNVRVLVGFYVLEARCVYDVLIFRRKTMKLIGAMNYDLEWSPNTIPCVFRDKALALAYSRLKVPVFVVNDLYKPEKLARAAVKRIRGL